MKQNILVIEDDPNLREALAETLSLSGYKPFVAKDPDEAMREIQETSCSLVVSDIQLGTSVNGIELLKNIKEIYPKIPVIIMTAYGSISTAVEAMKYGAVDYLVKPFEPEKLLSLVEKHVLSIDHNNEPIMVDSRMKEVFTVARKVANSEVSVLLCGESGTGKEVLSKYIHQQSNRVKGPFVAINCAAIPENMLEAILFGYEKGAFTGAYQSTPGKFELAQGGTILLDEISEMPMSLQAKLLRVLQEKEVERLGGKKSIKLDVRIISATNRNLRQAIEEGEFREDLFYRLSVFPIKIPSLRDRLGDIIPLAEHMIQEQSETMSVPVPSLSDDAKQYLLENNWKGNVRELENVIQRALILKSGDEITKSELTEDSLQESGVMLVSSISEESIESNLDSSLKDKEYQMILNCLKKHKGCRKKTAASLGISGRTLRYKIAKMRDLGYDIPSHQRVGQGDLI